jgi:hypothetical protein
MDLKYHFLACTILALILFPFYSYYSLLILIFGFFIDLDHYLSDVIRTNNLSLIESYRMHMNRNLEIKDQLHIFHTIEFIVLFILLTIVSNNFYLIFIGIGLVLHLILDEIYILYLIKKNIERKQTRASSLIFWAKRNLFN